MNSYIATGTGTDQNANTFTGYAIQATGTHTLTTTWQRFTVTASIPSTVTQIAVLFTETPTGTAGAADWFEITGCQLEMGSVATTFSRAGGTIQGELAACQRYYQRWTGTTGGVYLGFGNAASTASCYPLIQGLQLRTLPTSIDYASVTASDTGAGITVTSINIWAGEGKTVLLQVNAAGGSYALLRGYYISLTSTSAYIGLSAEL